MFEHPYNIHLLRGTDIHPIQSLQSKKRQTVNNKKNQTGNNNISEMHENSTVRQRHLNTIPTVPRIIQGTHNTTKANAPRTESSTATPPRNASGNPLQYAQSLISHDAEIIPFSRQARQPPKARKRTSGRFLIYLMTNPTRSLRGVGSNLALPRLESSSAKTSIPPCGHALEGQVSPASCPVPPDPENRASPQTRKTSRCRHILHPDDHPLSIPMTTPRPSRWTPCRHRHEYLAAKSVPNRAAMAQKKRNLAL